MKGGDSLLRHPTMEGLEFSLQDFGKKKKITEFDGTLIREIRIGF